MARSKRGRHPGHPDKKSGRLLARLSRAELEDLVFRQDAALGQRNVAIEGMLLHLPESVAKLRFEMYDLLLEQLPLDELYERMHRAEGWPA